MPRVTVTDAERVVWSGAFADFHKTMFDVLSVSEWCILGAQRTLDIGPRGGMPALTITLDAPPLE